MHAPTGDLLLNPSWCVAFIDIENQDVILNDMYCSDTIFGHHYDNRLPRVVVIPKRYARGSESCPIRCCGRTVTCSHSSLDGLSVRQTHGQPACRMKTQSRLKNQIKTHWEGDCRIFPKDCVVHNFYRSLWEWPSKWREFACVQCPVRRPYYNDQLARKQSSNAWLGSPPHRKVQKAQNRSNLGS